MNRWIDGLTDGPIDVLIDGSIDHLIYPSIDPFIHPSIHPIDPSIDRSIGSPLCNIDCQQINILMLLFIYYCFRFFEMFMLLPQDFLGIFKNYDNIRK